jgi:hypothetical protein
MDELDRLLRVPIEQTCAAEQSYFEIWQAHVGTLTEPFALALRGGAMADRFAWVFIAGYQAALRATFPKVAFAGWAALAVSEDRSEIDPLPGVTWRTDSESFYLGGYKTWVAASDHVAQIIIKARGPERGQTKYFLLDRSAPGLTISTNPRASMLPDLSQGRAQLHDVCLSCDRHLETASIALFGPLEAFYIYVAFLAMVHRMAKADEVPAKGRLLMSRAYAALGLAQKIELEAAGGKLDADQLGELDQLVQEIRQTLSDDLFAADENWLRDQRLIQMYSKGLRPA